MKTLPRHRTARLAALLLLSIPFLSGSRFARERKAPSAEIRVIADKEGCAVELDASPAGKTGSQGILVLPDVEPMDHYLHVRCPGEQAEIAYFVSPHAGESVEIRQGAGGSSIPDSTRSPLEAAEVKIKLRRDVQQAVRLRAQGRLEEAVQLLHEATKMDPENSDLHRELGITFLLDKEWKRARAEMLEAIRHDPTDADAHNGLGYALEKLGDIDTALKEYRIATHLEPDNSSYRQHYLEALGKLAVKQAEKKK